MFRPHCGTVATRACGLGVVLLCLVGLLGTQPAVSVHLTRMEAMGARPAPTCSGTVNRVVFSLTTTPKRVNHIRPVLDALLTGQSRPLDAVYLSVGPDVKVPSWLETLASQARDDAHPTPLRLVRRSSDPGPGLKLLGAISEEVKAGHHDALVIYGDDDVVYGKDIVSLHLDKPHCVDGRSLAWGPRRITAGNPKIPVLEATGTVSLLAGAVPSDAFLIGEMPDACRFSDDFYFAHTFNQAGLDMQLLSECEMNWNTGDMDRRCKSHDLEHVRNIGALSSLALNSAGKAAGHHGDWRDQLDRYVQCGELLDRQRRGDR